MRFAFFPSHPHIGEYNSSMREKNPPADISNTVQSAKVKQGIFINFLRLYKKGLATIKMVTPTEIRGRADSITAIAT